MALWDDPLYRLLARSRRLAGRSGIRGWLAGGGWTMAVLRLLPPIGVAATAYFHAGRRPPLPDWWFLAGVAAWELPMLVGGGIVLVSAAVAAAGDWRQGRMLEWLVTPMKRSAIARAQVAAWAFPAAGATVAGGVLAVPVWGLQVAMGAPRPAFSPFEGVLTLAETCAALFLMSAVGTAAGNWCRTPAGAVVLAIVVGVPVLVVVAFLAGFATHWAGLGEHLMLLAGAWIAGRAARVLATPVRGVRERAPLAAPGR